MDGLIVSGRERPQDDAAPLAIGLDVGGTKIAGGVVTASGTILERLELPTPPLGNGVEHLPLAEEATLAAIEQMVGILRHGHPSVSALGVGAAGLVAWPEGRIRFAPNNAFRDLALRRHLTDATGLPTVVDNDANVAAWAEATLGAGANCRHVVVLTVGTGIGGGLVLDGNVYRGSGGLGGEVGHIVVAPESGVECGCGGIGCLEAMASGSALGRLGRRAAEADPRGTLARMVGDPGLMTGRVVVEAARGGDPTARALLDQIGFWLGVGIASLVTLLAPEVVVVGGGLAEAGALLLAPATESFRRHVFAPQHRGTVELVRARLGPDAGLIGAGGLAVLHARAGAGLGELIQPV